MPILATFVDDNVSSSTKLLNTQSLAHVSGDFRGKVQLQIAPDGTTNWVTIYTFREPEAIPIASPDATVNYRFNIELSEGTAKVYLGE